MKKQHRQLSLVVLALLTVSVASAAVVGPAAAINTGNTTASDVAPYFNQSSGHADTGPWLQGVDNGLGGILTLTSRLSTFVVGGGGSGTGAALLSGVVVMGLGLGAVANVRVGAISGGTLSVAGVFAASSTGIAPTWLAPVVMFGIGLVLSAVAKRRLQV